MGVDNLTVLPGSRRRCRFLTSVAFLVLVMIVSIYWVEGIERQLSGLGQTASVLVHHGSHSAGLYAASEPQGLDHRHPLHDIIDDARTQWDAKLKRQSQTLKDAVTEYKRRYKREPPVGFDKWWAYVKANRVQLPDEYDTIDKSIRPFFGLSNELYAERLALAKTQVETYLIEVKEGRVHKAATNLGRFEEGAFDERAKQQLEFIEPIAEWLPDFEAVWSPHDTPRLTVGYDEMRSLLESRKGQYVVPMRPKNPSKSFISVCSSHQRSSLLPAPRPQFITNHTASFDLCNDIPHMHLHGQFAGKTPEIKKLFPIFTLSTSALHHDILGIAYSHTNTLEPVAWEDKSDSRALWRGSATGSHYDKFSDWRLTQRFRLANWGKGEGMMEILLPNGTKVELSSEQVRDKYVDVGLTGTAIRTCTEITSETTFFPRMSHEDQAKYKFVIDVDGNAWSARFRSLLESGSVIIKSTVMPEFYNDRIQPWVHYVPLSLDYHELGDIMAFFTGFEQEGMERVEGNEELAKSIAQAGREWTQTFWRQEDLVAYNFRLYLEYGRLGKDGETDYKYDPSHEVRRFKQDYTLEEVKDGREIL